MTVSLSYTLLRLLAIVPAFTLHELGHALVATWLGDPTPRWRGRLTLNPLAHVDWLGLLLLAVVGFGWAKPVEVNAANFRNPRQGMMLTVAAGPLVNLLLAAAAAVALQWGEAPLFPPTAGRLFLDAFFRINVVLFVFNLLPVPPLDGSHLVAGLFPHSPLADPAVRQYGGIVLMLLLVTRLLDTPLLLATGWLARLLMAVGADVAQALAVSP